jgi:hypothetical protein
MLSRSRIRLYHMTVKIIGVTANTKSHHIHQQFRNSSFRSVRIRKTSSTETLALIQTLILVTNILGMRLHFCILFAIVACLVIGRITS